MQLQVSAYPHITSQQEMIDLVVERRSSKSAFKRL